MQVISITPSIQQLQSVYPLSSSHPHFVPLFISLPDSHSHALRTGQPQLAFWPLRVKGWRQLSWRQQGKRRRQLPWVRPGKRRRQLSWVQPGKRRRQLSWVQPGKRRRQLSLSWHQPMMRRRYRSWRQWTCHRSALASAPAVSRRLPATSVKRRYNAFFR